jgi:hypothetical protein
VNVDDVGATTEREPEHRHQRYKDGLDEPAEAAVLAILPRDRVTVVRGHVVGVRQFLPLAVDVLVDAAGTRRPDHQHVERAAVVVLPQPIGCRTAVVGRPPGPRIELAVIRRCVSHS